MICGDVWYVGYVKMYGVWILHGTCMCRRVLCEVCVDVQCVRMCSACMGEYVR